MSGGWSPVVHLWSRTAAASSPGTRRAQRPHPRPTTAAARSPAPAAASAAVAAALARRRPRAGARPPTRRGRRRRAPAARRRADRAGSGVTLAELPTDRRPGRAKAFVDFQNDVKVSDVRLAAREGYASVEHAKRYTTLGMATDQGKLSNVNGLAVLADALATAIPAGRHHDLPAALYAGDLRRPRRRGARAALQADAADADRRLARRQRRRLGAGRRLAARPTTTAGPARACTPRSPARSSTPAPRVGMLDASTLGKILVKGPDAGGFPRPPLHRRHVEPRRSAAAATG